MKAADIEKTKKFFAERKKKRKKMLEERYLQAKKDFDAILKMIIDSYNPGRIYQWGSLLDPEKFSEISDIDIAVEGMAGPLDGLHAKSEAEDITEFPVDLVELERTHPCSWSVKERK